MIILSILKKNTQITQIRDTKVHQPFKLVNLPLQIHNLQMVPMQNNISVFFHLFKQTANHFPA